MLITQIWWAVIHFSLIKVEKSHLLKYAQRRDHSRNIALPFPFCYKIHRHFKRKCVFFLGGLLETILPCHHQTMFFKQDRVTYSLMFFKTYYRNISPLRNSVSIKESPFWTREGNCPVKAKKRYPTLELGTLQDFLVIQIFDGLQNKKVLRDYESENRRCSVTHESTHIRIKGILSIMSCMKEHWDI
jgi:hypothetical protein